MLFIYTFKPKVHSALGCHSGGSETTDRIYSCAIAPLLYRGLYRCRWQLQSDRNVAVPSTFGKRLTKNRVATKVLETVINRLIRGLFIYYRIYIREIANKNNGEKMIDFELNKRKRFVLCALLLICALKNFINFFLNDFYYNDLIFFFSCIYLTVIFLKSPQKLLNYSILTFSLLNFTYFTCKLVAIFIEKSYSIEIACVLSLIILNAMFFIFATCNKKRLNKLLKVIWVFSVFCLTVSLFYVGIIRAVYFTFINELFYPVFYFAQIALYFLLKKWALK